MIAKLKNKFFHLKEFSKKKEVKKITSNIKWMSFEKIFRLFVSVFVSAWVARYLGPEKFGLMNYVIAFVALFAPISSLGLDGIIVREVTKKTENRDKILGSALVLRLAGFLLLLVCSYASIIFIKPEDNLVKLLVVIVATSYFFRSFEIIDSWFKSQLQSKYTTISKNVAFVLSSIIKIILIQTQAPIVAFVAIFSVDFLFSSVGLVYFFHKKTGALFRLSLNFSIAKKLIGYSWPLILSGIAVHIYSKIDQVMLGSLISEEEVGFYSVAVKISEMFDFIPLAISASALPFLVKEYQKRANSIKQNTQILFDMMTLIWITISFFVIIIADPVVNILFGEEFVKASGLLSVYILAQFGTYFGVVRSLFLNVKNILRYSLYFTVAGAVLNVLLNIIFIPKMEAMGAVLATLLTYFFVTVFANIFFKETRVILNFILKSLYLPGSFLRIYGFMKAKNKL
jgi:PST family polysaccharide transporter